MSLVVELGQGGRVGMGAFEMHVVTLGVLSRIAALLAHVDLVASLFVGVVVSDAVHLESVRLERAALGETLVAVIAFIGSDT